jgi:hypothetical protein
VCVWGQLTCWSTPKVPHWNPENKLKMTLKGIMLSAIHELIVG